MFTGIIETVGTVRSIDRSVLEVGSALQGMVKGESVSVNGVCLTVTEARPSAMGSDLRFDYSPETALRTNIGGLVPGSPVNLERALRVGDRLGGHIMTGHIEGTAQVVRMDRTENSWTFGFKPDRRLSRYLVPKGSVGVDGISLTVVDQTGGSFTVAVIPHTMQNTNLAIRRIGDVVNIEPDILAKYVEGMLNRSTDQTQITEGFLREHGFIN